MVSGKYPKSLKQRENMSKSKIGNTNALKVGNMEKDTQFKKFLQEYNLKIDDIDTALKDEEFKEELKNKVVLARVNEKYLQSMIELYKSINARGTTMWGELISLENDILERKQYNKLNNINNLEDKHLQKALDRKFEIMKFLDRIKFDKQKALADMKMKQVNRDNNDDDLFTIEINPDGD
jgi:hypothetical protein